MNYTMESMPTGTIEDLADAMDLQMVVKERPVADGDPTRYYARFKGVEISEDGMLAGEYGNGPTPEEAIQEYAKLVSLRRLALNGRAPFGPWRLMSKRAAAETT